MFDNIDKQYNELKEKEANLRKDKSDNELAQRFEDALAVIEEIAVHQEELPKHLNTDKEKQLHKVITQVYRIAHTARLPGCFDKHKSWEEEFQQLKEKLNE